ncbi:peptidoglycan D,D-transpeptidase FtsI family protein [Streptomyces iconiensis]|uniref:Penicillin-binding protein 2 n=1 Tax=Streptomyces iconiensis TaxID=1384038 RepID=A0ABT7A204_9ACTN|nr:penicillin-binding protein 2 [Streptomyces iconiensis]MDJ1135336.1 penicillin-binding protein 2 [Streptomyces iconiensis]
MSERPRDPGRGTRQSGEKRRSQSQERRRDPRRVPRPARQAPARTSKPRQQQGFGSTPLRLANPRARLRLVAVGLTLVMLVCTVRLLQVQAVDADAFAGKAAVNRYITLPLAAERGTVSARDGSALATTVDAYDITADPYLFTRKQSKVRDAPERAAAVLAPLLHQKRKVLAKKLAKRDTRYVVLARQQTPQTWRKIKKLKAEHATKSPDVLAGVYQEKHAKRVYPNKELASTVLGFVSGDGKGGAGVEAMLDEDLAGEDGKTTYAQSGGRQVPTAGVREKAARPGSDIELTLDRDIQWSAQQAITDQVGKSGADSGYVIVQDTRTGELLAMASAPGFDPNDISRSKLKSFGNPALQDAYEPGSTSKLMSMAAVLEEGKATPGTAVTVPNRLKRADRSFADDVDHPTWHLTLNGVLAKSSNIGTILATEQLGRTQRRANKVLHGYLRDFGIGRPTGLGFPGETDGILEKPGNWSASQQYTIPFGQGLSLNAVQAASIYSTIANGGERIEPTLVRGTTGSDGRYAPAKPPEKRRVVSPKTARTLSRMLESVVDDMEGTGTAAKIPGYRVAGKTGTANRVDPHTGRYHGYTASFAGFAPSDKPRITVYCAVQNPKKGSYFGSDVCGPVYKKVMKFSLKSLQVPPTGAAPARLPVLAGQGQGG